MAKTPEKEAFCERLKQAIKHAPKRIDGPAALAVQFNLQYTGKAVTNQAVQKWLTGENRPAPDKIAVLARMFNVSNTWLRFGIDASPVGGEVSFPAQVELVTTPTSEESRLLGRYRQLSGHQRELIADLVEQLAIAFPAWQNNPSGKH